MMMMTWFAPPTSEFNEETDNNAPFTDKHVGLLSLSGNAVPTLADPIIGVKEETLGVFPIGLAHTSYPLIPTLPAVSLGTQVGSLPKQRGWRKGGKLPTKAFRLSTALTHNISPITHFSEGFYKGTLPDVLFVWGSDGIIAQAFIDELRFYIQKLNTMGFLLNANSLTHKGKTSIDNALPAIVLVGGGVWYHRFLKQLQQAIEEVGFCYTESKQLQQAVLGKICRGAMFGLTPAYFTQQNNAKDELIQGVNRVQSVLPETPLKQAKSPLVRFKLSGGKYLTQRQVLQSLGVNGIIMSIENEGLSPVERLELQQVHEQLQQFVLPYALEVTKQANKQEKQLPLEQYQQALSDVIFDLGLQRKAFETYEKGLVLSIPQRQKSEAQHTLPPLPADVTQCLARELTPHLNVVYQYINAIGVPDKHEVIAQCLAYLSKQKTT
jgi:hypothetical protein